MGSATNLNLFLPVLEIHSHFPMYSASNIKNRKMHNFFSSNSEITRHLRTQTWFCTNPRGTKRSQWVFGVEREVIQNTSHDRHVSVTGGAAVAHWFSCKWQATLRGSASRPTQWSTQKFPPHFMTWKQNHIKWFLCSASQIMCAHSRVFIDESFLGQVSN